MRILTVSALALALAACSNPERSGYTDVSPLGWAYGDTVSFTAVTADTAAIQRGSVAIGLRHTNNYEYSNIWLELSYTDADTLRRDTLNMVLADDFGNWHGTGVGVGYQFVDTVLRHALIDTRHPISVRHIMRVDTLADIEQVGIIFTPAKQ